MYFRKISYLAKRCLGALAEAVTEAVEVVVNATITHDGPPPQEPAAATPSWM